MTQRRAWKDAKIVKTDTTVKRITPIYNMEWTPELEKVGYRVDTYHEIIPSLVCVIVDLTNRVKVLEDMINGEAKKEPICSRREQGL